MSLPSLLTTNTTACILGTATLLPVLAGLYSVMFARLGGRNAEAHLVDRPNAVARRVNAEEAATLEDAPEYDVVIVGGGTAGCALAARLSEDADVRVLLLEAGRSSRGLMPCTVPSAYPQIFHSQWDYDLRTEPQAGANGKRAYWPRAKLLGGCSAINSMMFQTCAPSDYDEWALSGQEGASTWAYKEFVKYFRKFEMYMPHPKYPQVDLSVRGSDGPMKVGFWGHLHATSIKWVEAYVNLGVPRALDLNTPSGTLGVTQIMTYINPKGERMTTEKAYLTAKVLARPNLKVSILSHVTRILFETKDGKKRAVGVEFARNKGSPRYCVRAKHEVVLSAGAVHSPHILMLSGVGPKNHLNEHNIPLVHDLPGVGQHLQDHPAVAVNLPVKTGHSISYLAAGTRYILGLDLLKTLMALMRWKLFGTGPVSSNPAEAAAFYRSDDPKLFPADGYSVTDRTSGPNAPDLESIILPVGFSDHGHGPLFKGDVICLVAVLLRPDSAGMITLKSADPFDAPAIDPKYLSTPNDLARLVRGVKFNLRAAQTAPLATIITAPEGTTHPPFDHSLQRSSDAELEALVRARVETLYHPTSTCRMARLEDGGVVDPYLRVYGVEGLRVADAAIFPSIPSGHTAAPSIAVGEKAADIIKQSLAAKRK